ncbi:hypothetical protein HK405_003102 [Cladochytrium tenue]|nr:hypothetical protein HK405_003102 [Cladochytrium tenue]
MSGSSHPPSRHRHQPSGWFARVVPVPVFALVLVLGLVAVLTATMFTTLRVAVLDHDHLPRLPAPSAAVSSTRDISLDQIVLFGDSITEESFNVDIDGFGAILSNAYARRLDVINRGYGGFTTEWCKHFLPEVLNATVPDPQDPTIVDRAHVALLVLFLGANDATLSSHFPRYAITVDRYIANLEGMLRDVRQVAAHANVLLITTPPVDPDLSPGRSIERTHEFRDAAIRVAATAASDAEGNGAENVGYADGATSRFPSPPWLRVLDTWTVFLGDPDAEWNKEKVDGALRDGVHFSRTGNRALAEAILAEIRVAWPALAPEHIPFRIPSNLDLDNERLPDSAFVNRRV